MGVPHEQNAPTFDCDFDSVAGSCSYAAVPTGVTIPVGAPPTPSADLLPPPRRGELSFVRSLRKPYKKAGGNE